MNFKPELLAKVLNGTKTQTRRIVKPGERCIFNDDTNHYLVLAANGRLKWTVGKTYAAAPGRSKHGVAHFRLTDIRHEDVRQITEPDVKAEGFAKRLDFLHVWCTMHDPTFAKKFNGYREMVYERGYGGETTGDVDESFNDRAFSGDLWKRPSERYDAWALTFEVVQQHGVATARAEA